MESKCTQLTVSLTYPKHRYKPEDLLTFIESSEFTSDWSREGLDDEDDLLSLQLCIMANPLGHELIEGTGGLRIHRHRFDEDDSKPAITAFYGYFPEFGVVYLIAFDTSLKPVRFTISQRKAIRSSIKSVEAELERRKIIS